MSHLVQWTKLSMLRTERSKEQQGHTTYQPQMGTDPKAFSDTWARPGNIVMKLSSWVFCFSLLSYTMAVSPRRVEWMYMPLTWPGLSTIGLDEKSSSLYPTTQGLCVFSYIFVQNFFFIEISPLRFSSLLVTLYYHNDEWNMGWWFIRVIVRATKKK